MTDKIKEIVLGIATSNGILNRTTTEDAILEVAEKALSKLNSYAQMRLEKWLSKLSPYQLETLEDGEESEMAELVADSPSVNGYCTAQIFEEIYNALEGL